MHFSDIIKLHDISIIKEIKGDVAQRLEHPI